MQLILIRHGQTEWNASQKYQGHTDIPLDDTGRQQARRLAEHLLQLEKVEAVYASDLVRARETAEIIAQAFNLKPLIDPRLRELCFGKWEGLTFNQVYAIYRAEFEQWYNSLAEFCVPGGESFSDVANRSLEAIADIKQKNRGTVAAVTHGGVIKAVLSRIQSDLDLWQVNIMPASLTKIGFSNNSIAISYIGVVV
jgi:alpha-ribazole phosphatase